MDINESLQPVVASLIDGLKVSIEAELRNQISTEVINKIANTEINSIVEGLVQKQIAAKVDKFDFINASHEQLTKIVAQLTDQINKTVVADANTQINSYITQKLAAVDLNALIGNLVSTKIASMVNVENFPPQSISHASVNFNGVKLSGDHISGGIIEQFGSVGIEDRATHVQMTLMDHATAFEGPLWAPELLIKGNATIDGSLVINGDIATNTPAFEKFISAASAAVTDGLDTELFTKFSDIVFNRIKIEGLDLTRIKQNDRDIISGNQLGYQIIDSNLQRVGMLRDLQTVGESYLCETFYVSSGRVGINTMEPTTVFSVWDQEVEISINKHSQDVAFIGTPRAHKLVLGANSKENITLLPDGSVSVKSIDIGNIKMGSSSDIPNYEGTSGQIMWNENPHYINPLI